MGDRTDYFQSWYDDHKGALSESRKKKYRDDPEYREKVIQRSRDYRRSIREARQLKVPRQQSYEHKLPDGSIVKMYSIGALAILMGRSVRSVMQWQRLGVIPETPYRTHMRLYTRDMMDVVRDVIGPKRIRVNDKSIAVRITDGWKALGVPVGCHDGMEEALRRTEVRHAEDRGAGARDHCDRGQQIHSQQ